MVTKWPTGIRPDGAGIRITVWRKGRPIYDKTHPGNPHNAADLKAAIAFRGQLAARAKLGLPLFPDDEGPKIFQDIAQRYLDSTKVDPDSRTRYRNILNKHWLPVYQNWPICDITTASIDERLAATGLTLKTQKNILGPLRGVLRHAGTNPNPADGINWPRRKKDPVQRYLPQERDAVLAQLSGQNLRYFALLFATGLRPGEALGLLWADWDGELLTISKQITRSQLKPHTKTGQRRRVYVPEWVRPLLKSHGPGHIFVTKDRQPILHTRYLLKAWKRAHEAADIPLRVPYVCRHTRAAELLSRGVSPAEAASQLGHSPQMFLEIYSEFIEDYARRKDYSQFESEAGHQRETSEKVVRE